MEKVQAYKFQGQLIEFDLLPDANLMVNATEMAKIFGKETKYYLENKKTKEFIEALVLDANSNLGGGNSPLPNEQITSDFFVKVVQTGRANGTWMHRYVAIDFAMWLDVRFHIWVVKTIDEILTNSFREAIQNIKEKSRIDRELEQTRMEMIRINDPVAMKYLALEQAKKETSKKGRNIYGTLKMKFGTENEDEE